ncbi:MAG: ABC transporter permease [Bacteroidia bacterium]|nr:ABC transporter permease [Bacteroidia bacterium]
MRELLIRLRDWRFWIGVLSLPLLMIIVGVIIALLRKTRTPTQIYLAGEAESLSLSNTSRFQFVVAPPLPLDSLKAHLQKGQGLLTYRAGTPVAELYSRESFPASDLENLEQLLHDAILRKKLAEAGLTAEQTATLLTPPSLRTFILSEKGQVSRSAGLVSLLSAALRFILLIIILSTGWQVLLSVLEEKTNRLAEYLLIYISPTELLTGKLLAGVALALLQGGIWLGFAAGIIGLLPIKPPLLPIAKLPWGWIAVYVAGGILLYTLLYAAAGASSDSVTELSSFAQSLHWPLILSFILVSISNLQSGDPFSLFLSHFPLTSPLAMPLRLVEGTVGWGERILSAVILWGSVWAARFMAARLYRHALLLYGQKLSWKAIWKFIRSP